MYLKKIASLIGLSIEHHEARDMLEEYNLTASIVAEDNIQDPIHYLSSRERGLQIQFDNTGIIKSFFLFGDSRSGFTAFRDEIFPGLTISADRNAVIEALGPPAESGSDYHGFLSSAPGQWDRYTIGPASIHFQYSEKKGNIELITVVKRTE
jgi:hypothetical protein